MSTSNIQRKFTVPRITFIQRLEQVRLYVEINNSGWVPSNYRFPERLGIPGNFGAWATWVRYEKQQGRLRTNQVDALDQLGFVWDKNDVEKVLSRTRIKHGMLEPDTPHDLNTQNVCENKMPGKDRKNSILRASKHRPDGYPETVRDVGAAEDMALYFGLIYSDAITRYARADTDEDLAKQNAGPILNRMRCLDLGRIAMDDATIVLWTPPSLFSEVIALFDHWGFGFFHAGYWRKGVTPGHCHTRSAYEYFLVGKRGDPSWGLSTEYGPFLRGYVGSHIQYEDLLIQIFQAACDGPGLEVFGTSLRSGWTIMREPEPRARVVQRGQENVVTRPASVRQVATGVQSQSV